MDPMVITLIIAIMSILIIFFAYAFYTYNQFIELQNRVNEAFATMDVYLKKRWDLIPNLVSSVKGYAEHEASTLEEVISLRNEVYNNMSDEKKLDVNNGLSDKIGRLMMLAESYPDLKASANFLSLSNDLRQVEDDIANARKYYNACVRMLNNKVEMFPSNLIARMSNFKTMKMFEINASDREVVKVDL